jgi:hypothetical protein
MSGTLLVPCSRVTNSPPRSVSTPNLFAERSTDLLYLSDRDAQGRYNVVAEEDKSADYHFDIKHPPLNKPVVPKASRETFEAQMGAKLDKVQALAREIISSEHITIRLGEFLLSTFLVSLVVHYDCGV